MANPASIHPRGTQADRLALDLGADSAGIEFFQTDAGDDGAGIYRWDGAAWELWADLSGGGGGGSNLTAPPVFSNWAWINQGGAAAADSSVIFVGASEVTGIVFTAPTSSGDNVRYIKKAAPATPYTITLAYLANVVSANYFSTGFIWRESGSGKIIIVGLKSDGGLKFDNYKFNSATSPNSSYGAIAVNWHGLVWLRMTDNGTNRITEYSSDGVNWIQMHSVGRTDFLTADEVGFGIHVNNTTYTAAQSLVHWVVT